eukprot:6174023-Pleurochrysis_carterae.AAC.11
MTSRDESYDSNCSSAVQTPQCLPNHNFVEPSETARRERCRASARRALPLLCQRRTPACAVERNDVRLLGMVYMRLSSPSPTRKTTVRGSRQSPAMWTLSSSQGDAAQSA